MRIELLHIRHLVTDSVRLLSINCWYVGKYPLSYTILECIEVWCELVGWKLLNLTKEDEQSYSISVEVGSDEDIDHTLFENYYNFADLKGTI